MSAMVTHQSDTPVAPASGVADVALVPPHDLDAEAAVLSAVMLDPAALQLVVDFLLPEHFYSGAHQRIYEASTAVARDGVKLDVVTVSARLKATGRLMEVGGIPYLGAILDASPIKQNIRAHAEVVFERWRVRQTMLLCERASIYGHGVVDAQGYIDSVIQRLATVARNRPGEKPEANFDVLRRVVRMAYEAARGEAPTTGKAPAITTGIRAYDEHLGGLYAGQKTTIVARPRVGKTAFALQLAVNVAKQGMAVAFFSTEMEREEIADRQLAMLARIDSKRLKQARQKPLLSAEEWNRLMIVVNDEANAYKLHVFDDPGPSVDDICARAQNLAEQSVAVDGVPLGLVVVDYIQKLTPAPSVAARKKYEQIAYATERLKRLARELKVPVIELAQEKNSEKDRSGKRSRPEMGDAAESFQIERSADNVVYLYRPSERDGSDVRLACVKQRGGEEFEEPLFFERAFSHFTAPGPSAAISRQYIDLEPPAGRFDDDHP